MYLRMFAVYDSKALAFLQPFFSNSNGSAMRAFSDEVESGKSMISKHPGDFQLYEIGGFEDGDGAISVLSPNKLLCNGLDFVKMASPVVPVQMDEREVVDNGGTR